MNTPKLTATYISLLFLFLGTFNISIGQEAASSKTIFEYLKQDEGAGMTLEIDLTTILENRRSRDYTRGLIRLENGKSIPIKVKPRGKYRRKKGVIPPLKIKVAKKWLKKQGLDTLNEAKLVFPCFDSRLGKELIVKEYLIYKMFERLTSASVRSSLVEVTLRDNHVERANKKMYAILLEDNEETAARLGSYEVEQYGLPMDSMVRSQAALVTVFEYMIGNTDWDVSMMRNVRLFRPFDGSSVLLVPYDFDFAGLVCAPYASPSSESGLDTVMDRFLMANGVKQEDLRRAALTLKSAKKDIYDICYSKHLSRASTKDMLWYLDTFYDRIDKNNDVPVRVSIPLGK